MAAANLSSLPDELIILIFKQVPCEDRDSFSRTCKRFLHIYKYRAGFEFIFHLQGYSDRMFADGLKVLLEKYPFPCNQLSVSKFDLKTTFDLQFPDFNPADYLESDASKSVKYLAFTECILTPLTLLRCKKLFPNLESIAFLRSMVLIMVGGEHFRDSESWRERDLTPSTIKEIVISIPLLSCREDNVDTETYIILELYSHIGLVRLIRSPISNNRSIMKNERYPNSLDEVFAQVEAVLGEKRLPYRTLTTALTNHSQLHRFLYKDYTNGDHNCMISGLHLFLDLQSSFGPNWS